MLPKAGVALLEALAQPVVVARSKASTTRFCILSYLQPIADWILSSWSSDGGDWVVRFFLVRDVITLPKILTFVNRSALL
jgi:hypothetical protein